MSLIFSLRFKFVQNKKGLRYEFYNAYNHSNLEYNEEISPNTKRFGDNEVDVFVKH